MSIKDKPRLFAVMEVELSIKDKPRLFAVMNDAARAMAKSCDEHNAGFFLLVIPDVKDTSKLSILSDVVKEDLEEILRNMLGRGVLVGETEIPKLS